MLWLFIFAAFGAAWMMAFGVYCFGRDRNSTVLKWLGGLPLVALTLVGAGSIGFVIYGCVRCSIPSYVYESSFHERPTTDVTNLKSRFWSFADSEQVFLCFQASPETFQRIRPQNLKRIKFDNYRERSTLDLYDAPKWWHPPTEKTSEIYLLNSIEGTSQTFSNETTLMTFEATTGTVMYFFLGID